MAASPENALKQNDALLIVDVQNDFLAGGALAVPDGNAVLPVLNQYIRAFQSRGLPIFASRDWHPPDHCSFTDQGGPWPEHCIAGSIGAALAGALGLPPDIRIISKATQRTRDAYSAFDGTGLDQELRGLGVVRLFVGGLATDYCVLHTVKDGLAAGYVVLVLADAVRAVNLRPGDGDRALAEMARLGAVLTVITGVIG